MHYHFSYQDFEKDWEGKSMRLHALTRAWNTLQWCIGVFSWMVFNQFVYLYFLSPTSREKAVGSQEHLQHSLLCVVCGHGHWEGQTTQVGFLVSSIQSQPTPQSGDRVGKGEAGEGGEITQTNQPKPEGGLLDALSHPSSCTHIS